jgi:signal transduction histidine kinase
LLNLTRFEKGQMQITLGTVGLQRILDRVHSLLELDAANAQVELDLKLDPVHQNAAVLADDLKLTQVLTNLVMNAIKYNRIDGQVSVTLEQHEASWALAIRDTGMGFTPEQALRMFEPFNRLGLEKSTIEGTGIGLALAKRLVEAMDGRLSATATPGQGAVFTVELPQAKPTYMPPASTASATTFYSASEQTAGLPTAPPASDPAPLHQALS